MRVWSATGGSPDSNGHSTCMIAMVLFRSEQDDAVLILTFALVADSLPGLPNLSAMRRLSADAVIEQPPLKKFTENAPQF